MVNYVDEMFNWSTASTTLTTMNFGTGAAAGNYSPQYTGKLLGIGVICTPQAATSLAQQGRIELYQAQFKPQTLRFSFTGFGLATAPQSSNQPEQTFKIDQDVSTDRPIQGQVIFFYSPVTPNIVVNGYFSA